MPDHGFYVDGPQELPYVRFVWRRKYRPNLGPGGPGVESTARNCRKHLRKRVADRKHGFESRWGHQVGTSCLPLTMESHFTFAPPARGPRHPVGLDKTGRRAIGATATVARPRA